MMKHLKKIFLFILVAFTNAVFAQVDNKPVEMADVMRSNGKIYIVVAICVTILIGLFIYVWSVDRKVSKLEKE
jgi:tetrahydromethanopterin S-methyltransferase subunit D